MILTGPVLPGRVTWQVSQVKTEDLMSGPFAQFGVAAALIGLLMWLLIRSYSESDKLRAELAEKNDKLLAQHTELSERLLAQAVETAPLLREALDLLRQAAVMFEVMKQSANG